MTNIFKIIIPKINNCKWMIKYFKEILRNKQILIRSKI